MRNFLWALLIVAVFILASLVSIDGAPGATQAGCHVNVYAGGQEFTGRVTRSWRTSCLFAQNVTRNSLRFIIRHGGAGDGDFFIFAYSPVTNKNYRMHCWAHGDLRDLMSVDCHGGIGARVKYTAWENT